MCFDLKIQRRLSKSKCIEMFIQRKKNYPNTTIILKIYCKATAKRSNDPDTTIISVHNEI